jgi:hypothetical protein
MNYLGHLSTEDPLYGYLRRDILPQLGVNNDSPDFRVYGLLASNHVYLYEDRLSRTRIIGKFFGGISNRDNESAFRHMEREFDNLSYLRSIGFTGFPHYIARPLGRNSSLNFALIEECCYGTSLNDVIIKAILEGAREELFQKLTALAYFLATLHNRTAQDDRVDFNRDCSYFDRIMEQLKNWGHIGLNEAEKFYRFKDLWREKGCMWEDNQVTVHGDVTPTNILFGDGPWVIAIDLERMMSADRVFDIGRVAGEIKHFFMQYTGDKLKAEPFIGHFLWEYSSHFPDRNSAFESITRRVPFYMGLTLLRIARNSWITGEYRLQLFDEAKKTFK